MLIISFGRFHHISKDEIEKEKEDFLEKKRRFIANSLCLSYYTPKLEGLKESEIDEVIKAMTEISNNIS